jgi:hypothetical protein
MVKVKLVEIVEANFCKSEATNFNALPKTRRNNLGRGEAICFVSKSGNQLCFVHRQSTVGKTVRGLDKQVVYSTRLRLSRGTWDPTMLANYAGEVGLELVGLKRFEDYHARG